MSTTSWKIWIDTGGTFTDCIATTPSGEIARLKVLSSGVLRIPVLRVDHTTFTIRLPLPMRADSLKGYKVRVGNALRTVEGNSSDGSKIVVNQPLTLRKSDHIITSLDLFTDEEVPVLAARLLTQTSLGLPFPQIEMKLGSTRGTNALLERKGARTALLITKGFKDLLVIGNQQRPDLFTLQITRPAQLYDTVLEVDERMLASGEVHQELRTETVKGIIAKLRRLRIESVAVALVNSYVNPRHEQLLGNELADAGMEYVSLSHSLSRQLRILPRTQTAVVNAYLDPVIRKYLRLIRAQLGGASVKVMSSAGGLLELESFHPKDSLLSGPAGGVVGALEKARLSGYSNIITFDMGGTSTDVSRCANKLDYQFECLVGGQKILSPSLAIETIAAGGGSICHFDGYKLCVGPHSAGAKPGPACYGMGGPLTITDVNLLLGRISPAHFAIPLDAKASERAATALHDEIKGHGIRITRNELLLSFIDIANEKMAEAIRKISVQKGHDPGAYGLLSFGGAGGQHACALATLLGMKKIILPYDAGLLSAFGIGTASEERMSEMLVLKPLSEVLSKLNTFFLELSQEAAVALAKPIAECEVERLAYLRLAGQETSLEAIVTNADQLLKQFKKQYRQVYGHYLPHRVVEVESLRVVVRESKPKQKARHAQRVRYLPAASGHLSTGGAGLRKHRPVFIWESLRPGARIPGPSLIISNNSTLFLEAGWLFELDVNNNGILSPTTRHKPAPRAAAAANLALFTNRFTSLVEDMGSLLQRSSFSVNVKERLDFSCALLDADGNLVVNAPHIPVHLGSLGVCVRAVRRAIDMTPGDVVITNHPAFGGSHLPDITLIKPVHFGKVLIGYVVNRAHHAEIGGKKPGSMPADARSLEEEGVIIAPAYLVRKGVPQWDRIEALFKNARYPSRSPDENLADLNGGLAALMLGATALSSLCHEHSVRKVVNYMREIRVHAASLMRTKMNHLRSRYAATETLDDGSVLQVTITKRPNYLNIDFTGSSTVHSGNLNATVAIVNSVVLYVMRLLVGEAIPLNEGLFEHVKLVIPEGMLNPSFSIDRNVHGTATDNSHSGQTDPAVVGGNTEVSQRLTDTLLKAFKLAACSQGTMNNLLFGNSRFGHYETICGGAGATRGADGCDAVHTHMTNTRITDPEIMELKYPVRLEEFSIRVNSGGQGKWNGGNGVVRKFIFTDTLEVNILSQHRNVAPYGMQGGAVGKRGTQRLIRNGKAKLLKGVSGFTVVRGDTLIIETPGGGGWGKP